MRLPEEVVVVADVNKETPKDLTNRRSPVSETGYGDVRDDVSSIVGWDNLLRCVSLLRGLSGSRPTSGTVRVEGSVLLEDPSPTTPTLPRCQSGWRSFSGRRVEGG